ncbi:netrin-4-like isoform 3-T3 [Pholidichthys leucotaenia]
MRIPAATQRRRSFRMRLWSFLVIELLVCASSSLTPVASVFIEPAAERRCSGRACNPRMGNLALGRVLSTRSVCGFNSSEPFCFYKQTFAPRSRESCPAAKCGRCHAGVPSRAHPPSAMSDSSFRHPDTWWQSAEGATEETLQLDLETEFLFTHLILVFRSPRPAAMVLERSQDRGRTWKTLGYFARNCKEVFGVAEGSPVEEVGATCTSKYSGAFPCTRGEVHGKCVCRHNTAGDHCERCTPLHNDRPWQAANGIIGTAHECQKCKCNGHARSCHFSRGLWLATGRRSGGVCDDCRHNTEGRYCQNCKKGFYRDSSRPKTAPDSCKSCSCHPVGSVLSDGGSLCNPSSGACTCKPGVGGPRCDSCTMGYWGLQEYGCRPCDCTGGCDPYTGDCVSGSDVEVFYTATGHMGHSSNNSETALFKVEELFSALHHSEKCECAEVTLGSPKLFCLAEFDYVVMVKVMAAHDKGSHAEVEVKVKKVLYQDPHMKIQRGNISMYPESWTAQGCTCPILNPGSEYVVAGHEDWKTGRLMVNTKSFVKPWKPSLGRTLLHILRKHCNRW